MLFFEPILRSKKIYVYSGVFIYIYIVFSWHVGVYQVLY